MQVNVLPLWIQSATRRSSLACLVLIVLVIGCVRPGKAQSAADIHHELQRFRQMGRVLHVAAHPDDENTQLIAYFVHERGFETAYLSMTRGEGGQNLIGDELGDGLGIIRTHELLAARAIDGGRQFFTRAADFGYSKDYRETLEKWDHEAVLGDVVRVIRTFRPHVIITRFPPEPVDGLHGHHTASAVLAVEAFELAADPSAYPEQLDELEPWQPTRVVWNRFGDAGDAASITLDVGGYSALRGQSHGEIAAQSRSMHKSQGFGAVSSRGERIDRFVHLAGEPARGDLFSGVDASWEQIEGGTQVLNILDRIIEAFDPAEPSASVPLLLAMRQRLAQMSPRPEITDKLRKLDDILIASLGLHVETRISHPEIVLGEEMELTHAAIARAGVPVRWTSVRYPYSSDEEVIELPANREVVRRQTRRLPADSPVSLPHWLQDDADEGAIHPLPRPPYPIHHEFEVAGQRFVIEDAPVQVVRDPVRGEVRHAMSVIPPVVLRFEDEIVLMEPGETADVAVFVTATREEATGSLRLDLPSGWLASPTSQSFELNSGNAAARMTFAVQAPARTERAEIVAEAVVDGQTFSSRREEISYDHIPRQVFFPPARLVAMSADVAAEGQAVGYIKGAGDRVAESLERMGYSVTDLAAVDLTMENLDRFDTIVLGIRALNTRSDLVTRMDDLFEYVRRGGTLVMQYNTSLGLIVDPIAPHPLRLGRDRITDEEADLTPLAPDHPVLNHPNEIAESDFEGWVQERGLYFGSEWDDAFTPILAGSDPDEDPVAGALLVAEYGDGYFVYTGLSFFRQLPAGVPGAYRLFANIVSLGQ